MKTWLLLIGFGLLALPGCKATDKAQPERPIIGSAEPWSDEWLEIERQRYLGDADFRRRALEESLTNPDNIYSQTRFTGYGLKTRGWDVLPEWIPRTRIIDEAFVSQLIAGAPVSLEGSTPLWDGENPTDMQGWVELGRRVFYQYPLRSEVFAEHALRDRALAERIGLEFTSTGTRPGVVAFETLDGDAEIGITCALCHVSVEHGLAVEGRARRNFDYGEMRLSYYRDTGAYLEEDIKRRMATWGPGRADITQDDDEDPVAIVDLWGVRDHAYLTQSGTLKHRHPAALAIRQETQLLHANHERVRPPRELAWALAMYVYSLTPPQKPATVASPSIARGETIFENECRQCHSDKNYGGLPLPASKVGTDPLLARGKARGTGLYRPSPLVRVADAGPYLHDGTVPTLFELFDPNRTVPGHRYGTDLGLEDRNALVAFLGTL